MSENTERVVWAVDAFEGKEAISPGMVGILGSLAASGATIEPVYVLGPEQLGLDSAMGQPWPTLYQPVAERALGFRLRDAGVASFCLPARVLLQEKPGLRDSVDSVIKFAEATGARAIVTGTAGRSGLDRLTLGSFAETLLLSSTVPVVTAGPSATGAPGQKIEEILFPTDFGARAEEGLAQAIALAKRFRARLTVLHSIRRPIAAVAEQGVYLLSGAWVPFTQLVQLRKDDGRRQGEAMVARAGAEHVAASLVIVPDANGAASAILNQARASSGHGTLIFMAAQSGPVAAALLGSITRRVVREAPCPVWVSPHH